MDAITGFAWALAALLVAVGFNVAQLLLALWYLGRAEAREIARDVHAVVSEVNNADHG